MCVCVEGPVLVQDVREWLPRHGCRHLRGWQGKENHELGRCLCVCCYTQCSGAGATLSCLFWLFRDRNPYFKVENMKLNLAPNTLHVNIAHICRFLKSLYFFMASSIYEQHWISMLAKKRRFWAIRS